MQFDISGLAASETKLQSCQDHSHWNGHIDRVKWH